MKEKIIKVIGIIIEATKLYCTIAVLDMLLEKDTFLLAFDTKQNIFWSICIFCLFAYNIATNRYTGN
ncbi:hypothetical protein EXD82_06265 [Peptacetobacter hominis]|uniref:Uncharacterized protein n=1 Tax=Peptacetobacter hominis TaxID=2743610 RepID=A0A544QV68_9FIRM|nr:hypothetical protein [Peptacetobacter hominis]TQQ84588.1 hypothetical protein EXD82_06265 [Peptacetobacter hominis]